MKHQTAFFAEPERTRNGPPGPLVVLDPTVCPACTSPVRDVTWDQPALLRHGGYGATRRVVQRTCDRCGWTLRIRIDEIRPDRRAPS